MLFDRMIVSCVLVLHQSCQIFTSCSSSPLASTSCPVFLTSPGLLLYPPHLLFAQLPTPDPLNCCINFLICVFLTNPGLLLYPPHLHYMFNNQKNTIVEFQNILSFSCQISTTDPFIILLSSLLLTNLGLLSHPPYLSCYSLHFHRSKLAKITIQKKHEHAFSLVKICEFEFLAISQICFRLRYFHLFNNSSFIFSCSSTAPIEAGIYDLFLIRFQKTVNFFIFFKNVYCLFFSFIFFFRC